MELFLTIYLIIAFIAFVAWLSKGLFPTLTILASGFIIIAALPFYLLHTIIFNVNKENKWGVVFFIFSMIICLFMFIAYGR